MQASAAGGRRTAAHAARRAGGAAAHPAAPPRRPLLAGRAATWLPAFDCQARPPRRPLRATQAGAGGEARAAAHAPGRAGSYGAPGARRAAPPAAGSRAAALAAFVPERAAAAGAALAGALEARLRALPAAALGPPGAVVAEEALLLGGALIYTLPRCPPCCRVCRSCAAGAPNALSALQAGVRRGCMARQRSIPEAAGCRGCTAWTSARCLLLRERTCVRTGRLAVALGGPETALRLALGPLEAWRAAQGGGETPSGAAAAVRISAGRPAGPPAPASARFHELQEHFRRASSPPVPPVPRGPRHPAGPARSRLPPQGMRLVCRSPCRPRAHGRLSQCRPRRSILSVHRERAPQVALPVVTAAPAAGSLFLAGCVTLVDPARAGAPRRRVALRAHGAWAAWAAGALGAQMAEALRSDVALTSPLPLRGWEDTVVVQARAGALHAGRVGRGCCVRALRGL